MEWVECLGTFSGRPPGVQSTSDPLGLPLGTPASPRLIGEKKQREINRRERKKRRDDLKRKREEEEARKRKVQRKSEVTIVYKKKDIISNRVPSFANFNSGIENFEANSSKIDTSSSQNDSDEYSKGKKLIKHENIVKSPNATYSFGSTGVCKIDIGEIIHKRNLRKKGKDVFFINGSPLENSDRVNNDSSFSSPGKTLNPINMDEKQLSPPPLKKRTIFYPQKPPSTKFVNENPKPDPNLKISFPPSWPDQGVTKDIINSIKRKGISNFLDRDSIKKKMSNGQKTFFKRKRRKVPKVFLKVPNLSSILEEEDGSKFDNSYTNYECSIQQPKKNPSTAFSYSPDSRKYSQDSTNANKKPNIVVEFAAGDPGKVSFSRIESELH